MRGPAARGNLAAMSADPAPEQLEPTGPPATWWGPVPLPIGSCGSWSLGAVTLWIENAPAEWRVAWLHDTNEPVEGRAPALGEFSPPPEAEVVRFASGAARASSVLVLPSLADRPVVSQPEVPLYLLPGDDVSLYVGSPLWLRVLARPGDYVLVDVPTLPLRDTWFGRSTREGELCYATKTSARLLRESLPSSSFRATTHVVLRSNAQVPVRLQRMKLPAPELALYLADDGRIWSDSITIELDGDGDTARARLSRRAPPEGAGANPLADARQPATESVLERALGALLR